MLLELRLKDFVLIPEAQLTFGPGLIVFTGETGAGKSLLIQSLKLLLGGRGGGHLVRPGAEEAVLEAVLAGEGLAERLSDLGLPPGEEVVLRRVITPERSRIYINGSPATAQMLARLTEGFILLAGQHEHQFLSRPEERLRFLDAFAKNESLRQAYTQAYEEFRDLERRYEEFLEKTKNAEKERDFLLFQIREIEEVSPRPGEDEALEAEVRRLKNLSRLKEALSTGQHLLAKALEASSQARLKLRKAEELDPGLSPLLGRLEGLFYELEDLSYELAGYLSGLDISEDRLEEIEARLYQLRRLKRKYGPNLEKVLEELAELRTKLESLENSEDQLAELEEALVLARERVYSLGQELTFQRQEAARRLLKAIKSYLQALSLGEARFEVEIKTLDRPSESGFDQIDFLVATTPQSPLRPLRQVASGGELSRLFLALKVATRLQETAVLVFDEVDAGIGGETARKVGELLKELSSSQQVICVTHLPQIAALADQHLLVEKEKVGKEIFTKVRTLDPQERLQELSRMFGGSKAFEFAQRLLTQ